MKHIRRSSKVARPFRGKGQVASHLPHRARFRRKCRAIRLRRPSAGRSVMFARPTSWRHCRFTCIGSALGRSARGRRSTGAGFAELRGAAAEEAVLWGSNPPPTPSAPWHDDAVAFGVAAHALVQVALGLERVVPGLARRVAPDALRRVEAGAVLRVRRARLARRRRAGGSRGRSSARGGSSGTAACSIRASIGVHVQVVARVDRPRDGRGRRGSRCRSLPCGSWRRTASRRRRPACGGR